jgi:hypothetical protein
MGAALTQARMPEELRFKSIALPLSASTTAYQGGMACIDSSAGEVTPGAAGNSGLTRIGNFAETCDNSDGTGTAMVVVTLDKEVVCQWYDNATGANAVDTLFTTAYCLNDQTVTKASSSNSAAGRVWAIDSVKGVAVETTNL